MPATKRTQGTNRIRNSLGRGVDEVAIRGDVIDRIAVRFHVVDRDQAVDVPDFHRAVPTARHQHLLAVDLHHVQRAHPARVGLVLGLDQVLGAELPLFDGLVSRRREQRVAGHRRGQRFHAVHVRRVQRDARLDCAQAVGYLERLGNDYTRVGTDMYAKSCQLSTFIRDQVDSVATH